MYYIMLYIFSTQQGTSCVYQYGLGVTMLNVLYYVVYFQHSVGYKLCISVQSGGDHAKCIIFLCILSALSRVQAVYISIVWGVTMLNVLYYVVYFQHSVGYKLCISVCWMYFHFAMKPLYPELLNSGMGSIIVLSSHTMLNCNLLKHQPRFGTGVIQEFPCQSLSIFVVSATPPKRIA